MRACAATWWSRMRRTPAWRLRLRRRPGRSRQRASRERRSNTMCGIAGAFVQATSAVSRDTVARMLAAMSHRGPDGQGLEEYASARGERVLLGHVRLAIIDPVGSPQPMVDREAQLSLTFNGEIYNFRELRAQLVGLGYAFRRDSDTEVL